MRVISLELSLKKTCSKLRPWERGSNVYCETKRWILSKELTCTDSFSPQTSLELSLTQLRKYSIHIETLKNYNINLYSSRISTIINNWKPQKVTIICKTRHHTICFLVVASNTTIHHTRSYSGGSQQYQNAKRHL